MSMRRFAIVVLILFMLASIAIGAYAPATHAADNTGTTLVNPLGGDCSSNSTCVSSFLTSILKFVVKIGSVIVILMLVFVGYKFVAAQGEPGKITEARNMLLWTVVGALVLLGSQAIALGIEATVKAISAGS